MGSEGREKGSGRSRAAGPRGVSGFFLRGMGSSRRVGEGNMSWFACQGDETGSCGETWVEWGEW